MDKLFNTAPLEYWGKAEKENIEITPWLLFGRVTMIIYLFIAT